jgi:hypothetical protein
MRRACLFALLIVVACDRHSHVFRVADQVASIRSSEDYQLPGTRLFLPLPDNYIVDSARRLVRKNASVYFHYNYQPGEDFKAAEFSTRLRMDSLVRLSSFSYSKEFQMGPYSALVYYYPTNKPGQSAILIYFGDKSFIATAAAVFPSSSIVDRDSLLKVMCSLYQDEDARVDVSSSTPFVLDLSHSEFAYYNQSKGAYMYTIGGLHNGSGGPEDFFMVRQTAPGHTSPAAWLQSLVDAYRPPDFRIFDYHITQRRMDGQDVWELNGKISALDNKGVVYGVAKGDVHAPLILFATVFHEGRLPQVKEIGRSLGVR